jgi:O-methyltransferase
MKIENLVRLLQSTGGLDGNVIECGVYRGGSLVKIATAVKARDQGKQVFAVDTFEGHPYQFEEDIPEDGRVVHHKRLFANTEQDKVRKYLHEAGLTNVKLFQGLVEEVLPKELGNERFCFAHLDLDLYKSTKSALSFLVPRMTTGGIIVFDDYGAYESPGVTRAVDEILGEHSVEITVKSREGNQAYWKSM